MVAFLSLYSFILYCAVGNPIITKIFINIYININVCECASTSVH